MYVLYDMCFAFCYICRIKSADAIFINCVFGILLQIKIYVWLAFENVKDGSCFYLFFQKLYQ